MERFLCRNFSRFCLAPQPSLLLLPCKNDSAKNSQKIPRENYFLPRMAPHIRNLKDCLRLHKKPQKGRRKIRFLFCNIVFLKMLCGEMNSWRAQLLLPRNPGFVLNCHRRICPSLQLWISCPQSFGFVFRLTLTWIPTTSRPQKVGRALLDNGKEL